MKPTMALWSRVLLAGVMPVFSAAHAQTPNTWQPTRPVQLIVSNPPGAEPDFIVRLLAPRLSEVIKQYVLIDYRASNNGITGAEAATLYRKLPYDPCALECT